MEINAIYPAFDGEQNLWGIGAPTIFVRTQGCHLRCYLPTLGVLCDTPEALEKKGGVTMTVDQIISDLTNIRATSGISKVTLSGGDPLWRNQDELHEFFAALGENNFYCSVETSGTLDFTHFFQYGHVSFVMDYKLKSCGIEEKYAKMMQHNAKNARASDFIKFVVYDEADYQELLGTLPTLALISSAVMVVGPYWGGRIAPLELFNKMISDGVFQHGDVRMNYQVHKMAVASDYQTIIPRKI